MRSPRTKVKRERGGRDVMRSAAQLVVGTLACAAVALGVAARDLESPGLYYDEVIQAEPALWFLRAEPSPPEVPGALSLRWLGRPFPLMTQPYMGALKSQVLVPVLAATGPDLRSVRLATLAIALLGLGCAMAWVRAAFDGPTALCLGALLAVDPSFLFTSRHDWGSFALGFLLRSAAALLLLSGWRRRSAVRLFAGGACAGLAVYNKIDAAVPLAAAGAALWLAAPPWRRELPSRRPSLAAALAGLLLAASPMLWRAWFVLAMARMATRASAATNGEWGQKWSALRATLDGSYFARLMEVGGAFERMAAVADAPSTIFPLLFALSAAGLAIWLVRERRRGRALPAQTFALFASLLTLGGVLLTPHAVRIHHFLNAWPLPQLVVAVALREAWRRTGRGRRAAQALLALVFAAALLSALRVDRLTLESMRVTGGKGLWSDALERAAPGLSGAQLVCLDWGFAGPLRFLDSELRVDEPIWWMRGRRPVALEGDAHSIYLLHERPYAVFPFGAALLDAIAGLDPGQVTLERYADRAGDTAFVSVRFAGPHRLVYRGGRFEVQLR